MLKKLLGIADSNITSHSFRIRMATAFTIEFVGDEQIKKSMAMEIKCIFEIYSDTSLNWELGVTQSITCNGNTFPHFVE